MEESKEDMQYIIVKVKDDHEKFSKKVNELLALNYQLNGELNVIEQSGHITYVQGLYFDEDYIFAEEDEEQDESLALEETATIV